MLSADVDRKVFVHGNMLEQGAPWSMHNSTRGGEREMLTNELAVIPWGAPFSARTVVIVTPVGNREQAFLKSFREQYVEFMDLDSY